MRSVVASLRMALAPVAVGGGIAVIGALLAANPPDMLEGWREQGFDLLLQAAPAPLDGDIVVVDIPDLNQDGQAWSRADTARLLTEIAQQGPRVMALDIVLSATCDVDDTNGQVAAAIGTVPTVLGFLLAGSGGGLPIPQPAIAVMNDLSVPLIWYADGTEPACQQFQDVAASAAVISLAGSDGGLVREVPAIAAVMGTPYLGLAFDAVRVALQAPSPMLGGDPAWLRLGTTRFGIGPDGQVRYRPTTPADWMDRTVTATQVLEGQAATALSGKLVLVGSSSPRSGALRPTTSSPLHPSVQIHADVAAGVLSGRLPERIANAGLIEPAAAIAGGIALAMASALLAPALAALAIGLTALAWIGGALALSLAGALLLDPVLPPLAMVLAGSLALVTHAARLRRAEASLRRRISQLLPADVVARFVRNPGLFRLEGEERVVTALFTDLEGFTGSTRGLDPRTFVGVLDDYFSGMTAIVLKHGGMIDKFVGDAIHAFFNAPADVPDHVDAALRCALDMEAFSEAFREKPEYAALGLGRTRIGIETGQVILGDIGAAGKIDYTAYGDAVNMAARLEEANKQLGSTICIGPDAAAGARLPIRSLGRIEIRGFGETEVFTPRR